MKCPFCGGETYGKFCEFCGSELPSRPRTPDPETSTDPESSRPQRTSKPAENIGNDRYDTDCPRCGSLDIYFDKRRFGRMGYTGSLHPVSYHKIGICRKCGHTWRPEFARHNKVSPWLWVLGWICIFPVPVMILVNRQKKMSRSLKAILIVTAWLLYALMIVSGYLPYFQVQ